MKKNISNLLLCNLHIILFFTGSLLIAQKKENIGNSREEKIMLSYNTPFSYPLNRDVSWELKNSDGKIMSKGIGDFAGKIFNVPGNYFLSLHEKHSHAEGSCAHDLYPSKLNIEVSSMKMIFDWSTLKFSQSIIGGQSTKTIKISVDVDYSSSNNKNAIYEYGFTTAGVGTSVIGKLKNNKMVLKPGINTVEFLLDGIAEKGNYIMIDFRDINGQVQSYTVTQKIK